MSQPAPLPPPPIGPSAGASSPLRFVALAFLLLALAFLLELRLVNCAAGREAAARIRNSPQVRVEFGDVVHMPFAVGWGTLGRAVIYALVTGSKAQGYAVVTLSPRGGPGSISGLDVYNRSEGHLINLAEPEPPAKPDQLQPSGTLYFVALGEAASDDVGELASFFEKEFSIPIKILSPMPLPGEAFDERRRQWVAELLVQSMEARYPDIAADPDAKLVGFVEDSLYIRAFNWRSTFSFRSGNKYSVVPTYGLDPAFYRYPPSSEIRMERLRKIAMKAVGLIYLGFEPSNDPQSVDAFEGSLEDIDRMGSVYLAADARVHDVQDHKASNDTAGRPCISFSTANVAGLPLHHPITGCWRQQAAGENSEYSLDLMQGRFQLTRNDLYRVGPIPLYLTRENWGYHFDDKVRAFGRNAWQNLDDTVWSADPYSLQTISIYGTEFHRITPGNGFSASAKYRAQPAPGLFGNALLTWESNGWRIDTADREVWRYLGCGPNTSVQCYYMGHRDFAGDRIEVQRDQTTGHIQAVSQKTNPNLPSAAELDHTWTPIYDGEKIIEIDDSDGRKAHFGYDQEEYLTDVDADGHHAHYDYDDRHHVTQAIEDGRSLRIHYDSEGRPDRVDFPNATSYSVHYSGDAVEVDGPDGDYSITILTTFFRTVERRTSQQ